MYTGEFMVKRLSIVIPTHNRKDSILNLLKTIEEKYNERGDVVLSVIVVVDGSTDGTQEAIRSFFPLVTIIEGDGTWWWTKSVNEGCKYALKNGSNAVLLFNDDIDPDAHYFDKLLKAYEENPQAVIGSLNIAGKDKDWKEIYFSGAHRLRWWDGKLERYHPFLAPYDGELTGLHPTVVLTGRGLLIPAEVLILLEGGRSPLDEKAFPQYKADYDFVLRAHKSGIRCLISWDSVVFVDVKATGEGSAFIKQGFFSFLSSMFKKHSRTSLYRNFLYYKRHYPVWGLFLLPFTGIIILSRQVLMFLTGRKY
jgi:GT2 family glycosyltransferase